MLFFSPQKAEAELEKNKLVRIKTINLSHIKKGAELIDSYFKSTVNKIFIFD